jgi:hypothetical protein
MSANIYGYLGRQLANQLCLSFALELFRDISAGLEPPMERYLALVRSHVHFKRLLLIATLKPWNIILLQVMLYAKHYGLPHYSCRQ